MKIIVVGTGSISSISNSPSYIIDNKILIDLPNGNFKNIKRLNIEPTSIKHILITHFHGDHYFDIPFYLLKLMDNKNKDVFIYTNRLGVRKIKRLTKLAFAFSYYKIRFNLNINFIKKKSFKIDAIDVRKVKVEHGYLHNTYGYIIRKKDKTIGFTGDASYSKYIDYMAKVCDYLVCDCTFIKGNVIHMGIDNIKYLAQKYPDTVFYVTHMSDNTRKKANNLKTKNIIVLNDGDIIDI